MARRNSRQGSLEDRIKQLEENFKNVKLQACALPKCQTGTNGRAEGGAFAALRPQAKRMV
jgi:hypothetical protein